MLDNLLTILIDSCSLINMAQQQHPAQQQYQNADVVAQRDDQPTAVNAAAAAATGQATMGVSSGPTGAAGGSAADSGRPDTTGAAKARGATRSPRRPLPGPDTSPYQAGIDIAHVLVPPQSDSPDHHLEALVLQKDVTHQAITKIMLELAAHEQILGTLMADLRRQEVLHGNAARDALKEEFKQPNSSFRQALDTTRQALEGKLEQRAASIETAVVNLQTSAGVTSEHAGRMASYLEARCRSQQSRNHKSTFRSPRYLDLGER